MKGPLFSIVIPTYNRADRIASAVLSVVHQTLQDFEIIVVDDGSTDDTQKVLADLQMDALHVVRQVNCGAPAARNRGIALARGQYVAFLDSDDVFMPEHLERVASALGGRADVACYAPVLVDRGSGVAVVKPSRGIRDGEDMGEYLFCEQGFVPTITLVVPRHFAKRVRYDEQVHYGDDADFALRLTQVGCRFEMLPAPGAIWDDTARPDRLSNANRLPAIRKWADKLRPRLTARAYRAFCGWVLAKALWASSPTTAINLFLVAAATRCFCFRLLAAAVLQITLPPQQYRVLADVVLRLKQLRMKIAGADLDP